MSDPKQVLDISNYKEPALASLTAGKHIYFALLGRVDPNGKSKIKNGIRLEVEPGRFFDTNQDSLLIINRFRNIVGSWDIHQWFKEQGKDASAELRKLLAVGSIVGIRSDDNGRMLSLDDKEVKLVQTSSCEIKDGKYFLTSTSSGDPRTYEVPFFVYDFLYSQVDNESFEFRKRNQFKNYGRKFTEKQMTYSLAQHIPALIAGDFAYFAKIKDSRPARTIGESIIHGTKKTGEVILMIIVGLARGL